MTELLPCPFCGATPTVEIGQHNFDDAQVCCSGCGTFGPDFDNDPKIGAFCDDPKAEAIKHWNARFRIPDHAQRESRPGRKRIGECEPVGAFLCRRFYPGTSACTAHGGLARCINSNVADLSQHSEGQCGQPDLPRHAPQTIETAPKDGTHILAWRVPVGIRVTNNTNPPTVVHWFDDPDEPGFYTSVNERAPEHPFNPTHWERLPDPPLPCPLPSTMSRSSSGDQGDAA